MTKVTEQELIDKGFELTNNPTPTLKFYTKEYDHVILGRIKLLIMYEDSQQSIVLYSTYYPLTHNTLNLFIRFAEGKNLGGNSE